MSKGTRQQSEIIAEQESILRDLVHHLAYFRLLNQSLGGSTPSCPFWISTCNAHLRLTVINWCMIFGSPRNSDTHWRHVVSCQSERDSILSNGGLPKAEWEKYRKGVEQFRNKCAAHRDLDVRIGGPSGFDTLLKTVCIYDDWLRDTGQSNTEKPLKMLYDELIEFGPAKTKAAITSFTQCLPDGGQDDDPIHPDNTTTTTTT